MSQRRRVISMGGTLRIERTEGVYGPTIQGEGVNAGMPITFVRFYGCDFHCSWCDTPFAVPLLNNNTGVYDELTIDEIWNRINAIGCKNVVLSGGHPLIYGKKLIPLAEKLKEEDCFIQVETQGSIVPPKLLMPFVDFWSISPKLPSAGDMMYKNWKAVPYFIEYFAWHLNPIEAVQLKFVISDQLDYRWLKATLDGYQPSIANLPIALQPEGQELQENFNIHEYTRAIEKLVKYVGNDLDYWQKFRCIRVLPQLHKIIWQKERKR